MDRIDLSKTERQLSIVELINRKSRLSIAEICTLFSVSEATARRDLQELASREELRRVHGAAISSRKAPPELPLLQRTDTQSEEKTRIGRMAASRVHENDTIFLGSGTTALEVARNLLNIKDLTVITNSLPVMQVFSRSERFTSICLGGMLRQSELSLIGHLTEQALAEIRVDKVIMSVRAVSLEHGLFNDYLPETLTDRAILEIGKQVVLVADHTKFGSTSTAFVAPLEVVDTLVTDEGLSKALLSELRKRKIEVLLA